jgi:hypothetical protein
MKVKINKTKIKTALRRAIKVRNESNFKYIVNNSYFVKTEDTSEAVLNENYYFNMDIGSFGITIDEIMNENFSSVFFESRLKAIINDYNGEVKIKCDYTDENFQKVFKDEKLDLVMLDSITNFGVGDHKVKKYNINGFQFFMKVRCDLPISNTIIQHEIKDIDEEGNELIDNLIEFKENEMKMFPEKVEERKDLIIVDFYVPCIINKSKEINEFLGKEEA